MEIRLDTPVMEYPGVGEARAKGLARLGIETTEDLLLYYPRGYEDRREAYSIANAPLDHPVCIRALLAEPPRTSFLRKGLELTRVRVVDSGAAMTVTFFNQSYVRQALVQGESYVFFGQVEQDGMFRRMTNPAFEREGNQRFTGCIMPIYSLTRGVSNNLLAGMIRRGASASAELTECLPVEVRKAHRLVDVGRAIQEIHFPKDEKALVEAKRRIVFEELFLLTAGLSLIKECRDQTAGPQFTGAPLEEFLTLLPFQPTAAQRKAIEDLNRDLTSGVPMNRLIQGDVGSGKTVIAAYGAWLAWKSGYQAALMAPTEILAEQHCRTLTALLGGTGMRVALLTGGIRGRKKLLAAVESGDYHLIVGTHALLSEKVCYNRLGLAIADEQHRFGVEQRAALTAKGVGQVRPHVLVMSATPIPRTLGLIIYGDLDVSVINELPPGRTPVLTYLVGEDKRARMYGFVRRLVGQGRQAYIVCPAVEESESELEGGMNLKAVKQYAENLRERIFPDLRVGFVHGKLKSKDKEAVMTAFAAGELDILVSTTVIEVGVDVPNAALMIIENAERFGLSQLHQLRGRVGRGPWQSYCVLVTSTRREDSRARLKVMTATHDGFKVAEEDLKQRGPGDFFGARQHGLPNLRVANLASDMPLLQEAQEAAQELLRRSPGLQEYPTLLGRVRKLFEDNPDIFN